MVIDDRTSSKNVFDKIEAIYLIALRIIVLLIATILLGYAAYLAIGSSIKISRSADSVKEAPATVNADELATIATKKPADATSKDDPFVEERKYYNDFVRRYHKLFATRFEPYRQAEDKALSATEFGDAFVGPTDRLASIERGEVNFATDKADLEYLLKVMSEAAAKPATIAQLSRYKKAVKVNACENVNRTRTTYRRGWDSYSSSCAGWYQDPIGCPVSRPVLTDYVERLCSMKFPKGTRSHAQILKDYQDRFFALLYERRANNRSSAQAQRENISAGNAEGRAGLGTAIYVAGGFVLLMFFFLLIAIERHQRRAARSAMA